MGQDKVDQELSLSDKLEKALREIREIGELGDGRGIELTLVFEILNEEERENFINLLRAYAQKFGVGMRVSSDDENKQEEEIDTDRFVLSRVGKYGRKLHIFSGGWVTRSFCGRGPAKERQDEYSRDQLCKECAKMYPEIVKSPLAQMFSGF
jgi:hypothetical protein